MVAVTLLMYVGAVLLYLVSRGRRYIARWLLIAWTLTVVLPSAALGVAMPRIAAGATGHVLGFAAALLALFSALYVEDMSMRIRRRGKPSTAPQG